MLGQENIWVLVLIWVPAGLFWIGAIFFGVALLNGRGARTDEERVRAAGERTELDGGLPPRNSAWRMDEY